jgi:hypothetical protein
MAVADAIVAWSGWAFGLFSAAVTADSMRRAASERRASQRMARALSERGPVRPAIGTHVRASDPDNQLRAFLVHAAAARQPLAAAIGRAKNLGVSRDVVIDMAKDLRRAGLLEYEGDLSPATTLILKVS